MQKAKNLYIIKTTEDFVRGEMDNVTLSDNALSLEQLAGGYVLYGCYTSPVISFLPFTALALSWNAETPKGSVVEAQCRVMVGEEWSPWISYGHESIIAEAKLCTEDPDFKGYIHDVGGPTANFRAPACKKQLKYGACVHQQCLFPKPCKNLIADHTDYLQLLRKLRKLPKVKKVFIRSGIRFDYLLADKDDTFFRELCQYHVSGQLKVAPEHIADPVLEMMGKPQNCVYEEFTKKYKKINEQLGLKQYLVPYLMSSHPGSTLKEAVELAEYLRDLGYMPEQVQDFYPTPSTISTCMYYTGVDPRTMKPVYVPKNPHEKAMQRALIQYRNPKNYDLVMEALKKTGRMDLVGFDEKCLIRPRKLHSEKVEEARNKSGHSSKSKTSDRKNTRDHKNSGSTKDIRQTKGNRKPVRNVHKKK